jgi:hypothetical protein
MAKKSYFSRAAFVVVSLFVCSSLLAQGSAGTNATLESRHLIDLPTAGITPAGDLAIDVEFFQESGFLTGISIGALDRMMFGISYGGTHVVGGGDVQWNNLPGFQFKLRIAQESVDFPAIAVGINTQGKDPYIEDPGRYTIKSMGAYLVGSKNYECFGYLAIHAGVNYSFEHADGDKDINLFASAEKTLGPFLSILGEYDLGSNDNSGDAFGKGRGYLNLGARVSVGFGVSLSFAFKDLLHNGLGETAGNRVIQLEFVNTH